jgi:hypothetical protein
MLTINGLIAGEVEVERLAFQVAFEVDLGAEPAAGPAERLVLLPPFALAAEIWARIEVLSNIGTKPTVRLHSAGDWKSASNVPPCDRRQNRFRTLFQSPNSAGGARQVMLCSVKQCNASRKRRSSRPFCPRREHAAWNNSRTIAQSSSVIRVSMVRSNNTDPL